MAKTDCSEGQEPQLYGAMVFIMKTEITLLHTRVLICDLIPVYFFFVR